MSTDMKGKKIIVNHIKWEGWKRGNVEYKIELTVLDHILVPHRVEGLTSNHVTSVTNYLCIDDKGNAWKVNPDQIEKIL